jgi:hypothetical protein
VIPIGLLDIECCVQEVAVALNPQRDGVSWPEFIDACAEKIERRNGQSIQFVDHIARLNVQSLRAALHRLRHDNQTILCPELRHRFDHPPVDLDAKYAEP